MNAAAGTTAAPRADSPAISVIVPAFNEAGNIDRLLTELIATLARRPGVPKPGQPPREAASAASMGAAVHSSRRWEVIVVDDGSSDGTWLALQPWLVRPGVRALRLSRNFGKEAALTAGLDHAQGEVVVLMDADGQHPVAMLEPMLAAWRDGADMVCAVRRTRDDESLAKRVGTRWFYRLANAGSPVPIPPGAGDFRLLDRRVVDALRALPERNRFMKGLYAWVGFETRFLPYTPVPRHVGRSRFSLRRLLRLALTGLTAFSNFPLRIWSGVGASIALLALGYGAWIAVEHALHGHPIPGWATLATGLMFFSGVQLLSIGILGEYIGRVFDEVKQRPIYLVAVAQGRGQLGASVEPLQKVARAATA